MLPPAGAVSAPLQLWDDPAGSAISRPAGRSSVNSKPDSTVPLAELSIVNVRVLRLPNGTDDGEKLLVKPGRSVATVRSAVAAPLLPALDVRSPETLVWVPTFELVTSTSTVQVAPAATSPSENVMVPPPSGAMSVAGPQSVVGAAGSARTIPAGKVSVKPMPVAGLPPPLLSMVKTSRLALPGPMVAGEKDLENEGWAAARPGAAKSRSAEKIDLELNIPGREANSEDFADIVSTQILVLQLFDSTYATDPMQKLDFLQD